MTEPSVATDQKLFLVGSVKINLVQAVSMLAINLMTGPELFKAFSMLAMTKK
jgi:hypothetical protein